MTIKALFPSSEPALELDFANTKALDPRVVFTRASTGTYVGADGLIKTAARGAARFEHNPATGESLGLLVEEARTNRVWPSQFIQLNVGGGQMWTGDGVAPFVNYATVAPDQTLTAAKIYKRSATPGDYIHLRGGSGGTQTWQAGDTVSCFFKAAELSTVGILFTGGSTYTLNLSAGTVNIGSLVVFQNGWYRWTHTFTSTPGDLRFYPGGFSYSGDGTSGVFLWGAQGEIGSFPTSYIPTTSAAATRAADVATLSNANSRIFPTSAFTTVNSPFGTAGGGSTVKLVGPTIKRTAIYAGDLPQVQINALTNTGDFWRWRVVGSTFALQEFTTNGSVTVDWGDGVVETLTTAAHTFTNGGGYHDIGFRLNSGTFFEPRVNGNATYASRVIALGPAPASMKVNAFQAFLSCTALRGFDATVDTSVSTSFQTAWQNCSSLASFPLINTAAVTSFFRTWQNCSELTSFPLINTSLGTAFQQSWQNLSKLTSFPLINTSNGTTFETTWMGCGSLQSFPLINTSSGVNFTQSWRDCGSLTSFPALNFNAATGAPGNTGNTGFLDTWRDCTKLANFPANMFNTTTCTRYIGAFFGCALTATSIENILVSLNTAGTSNGNLSLEGGTNAGASTWTANAVTAYNTLISRGWTITRNA